MDSSGKVTSTIPPSSNNVDDNKAIYKLDPMSFLHLDLITKILMRESNSIYTDFKTKLEFIREQEGLLLGNERNLIAVHEIKEELNVNLLHVEEELLDNENHIIAIEMFIENLTQNASSCPRCGQYCYKQYDNLVELFKKCQNSVADCNRLRQDVDDFNEEASNHASEWGMIYKIFDSHLKLIENAEIEVEKLEVKVKEIAESYNKLAKKFCDIKSSRS